MTTCTCTKRVYRRAIIWSLVLLLSCTVATSDPQPPLITRLAKDPATSLYTTTVETDKSPLVVDLAGSLVWSTCPSTHSTVPCESATCATAKEQSPPRCRYVDGGRFWENRDPGSPWCACTAHPLNPVSGECSTGDLTSLAMSTNNTTELLPEESFAVVGACAPGGLLNSLPAGVTGVAGFSRAPLSLPSQLVAQRGFGNRFSLCLPVFATFGDTPVYLPIPDPTRGVIDFTTSGVAHTPLLTSPSNASGYYIPVKGISVSWHGADATAQLPAGALDLDVRTGRGGVMLSTVTPYATMRPDVFRAFARAFDDAITRGKIPMTTVERVPATKPFELCYRGGFPRLKRPSSWDVPRIILELGDGATMNWTVNNNNYLVEVDGAMCVGILPMAMGMPPVDGQPAMVIGGKQMENNLLVFDLEKQLLGFSGLLDFALTSCGAATFFRN
uniref:Uncharacterized protein n=1 Tax=Avena sativa TaxID=4498 RepID=A0ACD5XDY3_AVESA